MEMKDIGGFRYKGEYAHERLPRDTDSLTSLTTVNQSFQRTMNFNQTYTILTSLIRHSFMLSLFFLYISLPRKKSFIWLLILKVLFTFWQV